MIEPMIEPIFVILGILASVAIPRLAATREDAEISAAVANLRTLVSDAGAYYTVNGNFTNARWNAITNVPLVTAAGNNIAATATATSAAPAGATGATGAYLKVGGKSCIGVQLVNKNGTTTPAHIQFTKKQNPGNVCTQVLNSKPVQAYINSTVPNGTQNGIASAIAIGSNTSVYP